MKKVRWHHIVFFIVSLFLVIGLMLSKVSSLEKEKTHQQSSE